jgi:hypothetical protein
MKLLKGLEDGTKIVTSIYISSGNNKKELGAEQYLEAIANNYNCSKSDVIDHLSKLEIIRLRPPKELGYSKKKVSIKIRKTTKDRITKLANGLGLNTSELLEKLIIKAYLEIR